MVIALLAALFISASALFAAESSVPGDLLYPIKISINEEVRGKLSLSEESRAAWEARLAERRLEEVEELSAKAEITGRVRTDIESKLDAHFRAFEEAADRIESSSTADAAAEAYSGMEVMLQAHARALANISAQVPAVRPHVEGVLAKIRARLSGVAQARANAEARLSAEAGADVQAAAEGKRRAAENKITEAKVFIENMEDEASATLVADANAKLRNASALVANGRAQLESREYAKAFITFSAAHRMAQDAKLTLASTHGAAVRINALSAEVRATGKSAARTESVGSENSAGADSSADIRSTAEVKSEATGSSAEAEGSIRVNLGL